MKVWYCKHIWAKLSEVFHLPWEICWCDGSGWCFCVSFRFKFFLLNYLKRESITKVSSSVFIRIFHWGVICRWHMIQLKHNFKIQFLVMEIYLFSDSPLTTSFHVTKMRKRIIKHNFFYKKKIHLEILLEYDKVMKFWDLSSKGKKS